MSVITALILFSALAALVCAKARAAGPALWELIGSVSDYAGRAAAEANGGGR
jgi:hypothetical protein